MAIIRFNDPFAGLTTMHQQLDELVNGLVQTPSSMSAMPAMDVYTNDDKEMIVEVHAPGFTKDDIEISIHDGMLELQGQKSTREEDKDGKKRAYMVRESSSSFYRRIGLPKVADGDNVKAHFKEGMLTITVPFRELPKPKKVSINASGSDAPKAEKPAKPTTKK